MSPLPRPVTRLTDTFLHEVDQRLPGRVTGLLLHGSLAWDEFLPASDVDFVCVWDALPQDADLVALEQAHLATRTRCASPVFDGFHCTADDLEADPLAVGPRPVFYEGRFDARGDTDINPVTWHELAERPVVVRGDRPSVRTDHTQLVQFTRDNLDTYWRSLLEHLGSERAPDMDCHDDLVLWTVLGSARLHHLLARGALTSKSGAGRYVIEHLDPRWHPIAREALRLRERPGSPSLYADADHRRLDTCDLLAWVVAVGTGAV